MQILVAVGANALTEFPYHAGIGEAYAIIRANDEDSVFHSLQYAQKLISLASYQSLKMAAPFGLIAHHPGKGTYDACSYGKGHYPEHRVGERRDAESTGQKDNERGNCYQYRPSYPKDVAGIDYWNEKKDAMQIVHTVEEVQA